MSNSENGDGPSTGNEAEKSSYFEALGRFIHEFSGVETLIKMCLRVEANVSKEAEGPLFEEISPSRAISLINSIRNEKNSCAHPLLKRAFDQLKRISFVRNSIVHHGSSALEGTIISSKRFIYKRASEQKKYECSPDTLDQMTHDLGIIKINLMNYIYENTVVIDDDSLSESSIALMRSTRSACDAPWQYK